MEGWRATTAEGLASQVRPSGGIEKYAYLLRQIRAAGVPRCISAAKHVAILQLLVNDESLSQVHEAAKIVIQKWMDTPAYQELGETDEAYVAREMCDIDSCIFQSQSIRSC